jgi:hypothetical protein
MPNKPLPQFVAPMAAGSVKEPFDSTDWIFEPKLDGYRAITVIDSTGKARLWSRNYLPLEPKFPTIQDTVNQLKLRSTILDGEIVALEKTVYPAFSYCNNGRNARPLPWSYICSICFGVMGVTLPARGSCNDVTGWNRSSILFRPSKLAVTSRIVESSLSPSQRERTRGHSCQTENQHLPTWKTITGLVED